jgi:hypothetical protein
VTSRMPGSLHPPVTTHHALATTTGDGPAFSRLPAEGHREGGNR